MKKSILIILLLLFSFTLAACRETEDPNDNDDNGDNDIVNGNDDEWKVQYDIVESSNKFYENVDTCYQIFPISYADSTGDGKGDFMGIVENVEYLSETLGIDCIWLNPFNPSTTYHKYDVTDYYGIDSDFGSMEDFDVFIETMHDHDILVLMDLVINHSSFDNPWFINSRRGEDASKRDWYTWNDLDDRDAFPSTEGWHAYGGSYYYGSFWDRMPEFNYDNPEVREEMHNIAEFWLEKGIDGFRIDAARHIYDQNQYPRGTNIRRESIDWFREFNHYVKQVNPDAFVVGEVWTSDAQYVAGFYEGMDSNFNFRFSEDIITTLQDGRDRGIIENLLDSRSRYSESRDDFIDSVFITNHDQDRIMSELSGDVDKARQAAHILLTMPSIAWIYYGEEIGMTGEKPDPSIRQPFIWDNDGTYSPEGVQSGWDAIHEWDEHNLELDGVAEQLDDEDSLLNSYIELIQLRREHAPLGARASLETVDDSDNRLLSYLRSDGESTYLIIHNLSRLDRSFDYNFTYELIHASHPLITDDNGEITLEPLSTIILDVSDSDQITINP